MTELPAYRDRSRWVWIALGILLVLAVAAVISYRPAKRWITTRHARKLAAEAQQAMNERLVVSSSEKIKGALRLAPADSEVLRVTARFLSMNGQGSALGYWEQLLATGRATPADRKEMVRLALNLSRLDISQAGLNELLQLDASDPVTQGLALDQLIALGNWRGAVDGARIALKDRPTAPELKLVLARALLASDQPGADDEALPILRALAPAKDETGKGALRALVAVETLAPAELVQFAEQLVARPDASLADKLAAFHAQWQQAPALRAQIQEKIPALLTGENGEEDLVSVAEWLRGHEAYAEAERLVPAAASAKSESLFLVRIEVLADLKKWDEATALIDEAKASLPGDAVACANAHLAAAQGKTAEIATHLKSALEAAGARWSRVKFIATYAKQMGHPEIALEAWERLLGDSRYGYTAANQLISSLPDRSFVEHERKAYRTLARLKSNDPEVLAQDAYLDLLFNENLDRSLNTFHKLLAQHPESTSLGVGIAFAKLRQGKAEEALTTIENLKLAGADYEPHCQAIHAAVLAANHQLRDARAIAERIPPGTLRPQEQKLIKDLLPNR